ncbi:breast cancer type 2 susceptibility protein-like isoform X2 [Hydractinia symbiolongicarpus]|nr:breast cancer type 2 susceptibility protein-like isoform X2 [Hydractinia symbiolongicarpus]
MTPLILKRRLSNNYSKRFSRHLSLNALLDPDVEPVWSNDMATPPKDNNRNETEADVKKNDSNAELCDGQKKSVARVLFDANEANRNSSSVTFFGEMNMDDFGDEDENESPASPTMILSATGFPKERDYTNNSLAEIEKPTQLSPSVMKNSKFPENSITLFEEVPSVDLSKSDDLLISPPVVSFDLFKKEPNLFLSRKRKRIDTTESSGIGTLEGTTIEKNCNSKIEPDNCFISPPLFIDKKTLPWEMETDMKIMSQSTPIVPSIAAMKKHLSLKPRNKNPPALKQNRKLDFDDNNVKHDIKKLTNTKGTPALSYLTNEHVLNELMDFNSFTNTNSKTTDNSEMGGEPLSPAMTSNYKSVSSLPTSPSVIDDTLKSLFNSGSLDSLCNISESALLNHADDKIQNNTTLSVDADDICDDSSLHHTSDNTRVDLFKFQSKSSFKFEDNEKSRTFLYPKAKKRRKQYISFDNVSNLETNYYPNTVSIDRIDSILAEKGKPSTAVRSRTPFFKHGFEKEIKKEVYVDMDDLSQINIEELNEQSLLHEHLHEIEQFNRLDADFKKKDDMLENFRETSKKLFKKKDIALQEDKPADFYGLGKKVEISEKSLKAAKKLLDDEETTFGEEKPVDFCGFQTGLGKKVKISEKSLKAAKKLLDDEETTFGEEKPADSCGFQTGLGKKVEISEKSLKAARKLLDDEETVFKEEKPADFCGFQTGLGKKVKISEKSLKAARKLLDDKETVFKEEKPANFCGFQTGLGKKVKISEKSLKAAKKLLDDEETAFKEEKPADFCGFQTGLGKKVEISEKSLKAARKLLDDEETVFKEEKPADFCGFQTGLGKKVKISEKSLKAARKLLDDEETAFKEEKPADFCGFQTGLGKKVEISEKSLKAARKLLDDEETTFGEEKPGDFCRFQTGLGKKVEISEKSLKAARKLLDDEETTIEEEKPGDCCGFQTGLGKKVEISEKSMKAAKKLLDDEETTFSEDKSAESCGFQTGLGKKVEISEKSMKAAKKLLNNEEADVMKPDMICDKSMNGKIRTNQSTSCANSTNHDRNDTCIKVDEVSLRGLQNLPSFHFTPRLKTFSKKKRKILYTSPAMYETDRSASLAVPLIAKYPSTDASIERVAEESLNKQKKVFITPFKCMKQTNEEENNCTKKNERKRFSYCPFRRKRVKLDIDDSKSSPTQIPRQTAGRLYSMKKNCKTSIAEFVNYVAPQDWSRKELHDYGITDSLIDVDSGNALSYTFDAKIHFSECVLQNNFAIIGDGIKINFSDEMVIGVEEFCRAFLNCKEVDSKLVNKAWIENHYRWIVWKLASYERRFPEQFSNRCLSPSNVMYHLKYRYDKEIDLAERCCLKRIYERDDISTRRMVLSVSDIPKEENINEKNVQGTKKVIELTDGWYPIKAILDQPLSHFLENGIVKIGTKLLIYGAELTGSNQGCLPLEAPDTLMLQLYTNSTRRASWEAKLGYQFPKIAFCVPLKSLYAQGGAAGCVNIKILRKYPMQWMEKIEGRCIFRNKHMEELEQKKYLEKKQQKMEDVYNKIQQTLENTPKKANRRKKRLKYSTEDIKRLSCGKTICDMLENSVDPSSVESLLTSSQKELAASYKRTQADALQAKLMDMFNSEWKTTLEDFPERTSIELQRYRVADNYKTSGQQKQDYILTVWKPTHDIKETWKEGVSLSIFHLNVAQSRYKQVSGHLQLSTTNNTKYQVNLDDNALYTPRHVRSIEDLYSTSSIAFNEVDVVGCAVKIVPDKVAKGCEQTVYICDETRRFLAVKFWGGLQTYNLEGFIDEGSILAFTSLTWPKYIIPDKNKIIHVTFTDFSSMSRNPKESYLKDAFQSCKKQISSSFLVDIKVRLNEVLQPGDRPLRSVTNTTNKPSCIQPPISKIKIMSSHNKSIETHTTTLPQTLTRNSSENLPSEKLQTRHKLQIKKRLTLERYREPPCLSPLSNYDESVIKSQFTRPYRGKR